MITFSMRIVVPPEKRGEVLEALRLVRGPTRVLPGCINFQVYQEVDDANALILLEEWKSRAELDNHIRSEDFRKILFMMDLSSEPPVIQINAVSRTGGIEVIQAARA